MNQTAKRVTLDVGGQRFVTLASTLQESHFLSTLVSGRWDHNQQEDGSFFIEADPDLFKSIMEYLRRQWMPFFWDRENGHDLSRYNALLQEAEYYGIEKLSRWLREAKYLEAVTVTTTIIQRPILDGGRMEFAGQNSTRHRKVDRLWRQEDLLVCPIDRSHSVPFDCDARCPGPTPLHLYAKERLWVLRVTVVDEAIKLNSAAFRPVP